MIGFRYYDLNDNEFEIFVAALKTLRPRFNSLCSLAGEQQKIFFMAEGRRPKIKLESVDRVALSREKLDSDFLFSCFESEEAVAAPISKAESLEPIKRMIRRI